MHPTPGPGQSRPEPEELGPRVRRELLAREPSLRPLADGSVWALSAAPVLPVFPLITTATTTQYVQSWTCRNPRRGAWGKSTTQVAPAQNRQPKTRRQHRGSSRESSPRSRGSPPRGRYIMYFPACPSGRDRASPFNPWEWAALSDDPTRACENHGQPLIRRPLCA